MKDYQGLEAHRFRQRTVAHGEERARTSLYHGFGLKRLMDISAALALMALVGPVIVLFWALVRRDGGSGFYGQTRVGRGGRVFTCWKLRSMCMDAEARLAEHLAADPTAAAEWVLSQKLRHDPRITTVGHLIRKYSIDELPQLWNVLRGDMSLVGPRPVRDDELARYGTARAAYQSVRPGITGLWQVSGRNQISYSERVALDRDYAAHVTFTRDLSILLRTVRVVLRGTGH